MERAEKISEKFKFIDSEKRTKTFSALKFIACAAGGLILSHAKISGKLSPLGLAFSAALPEPFAGAAAVGAIVGYFLSFDGLSCVRYISCVAGVALINFIVTRYKGQKQAQRIAPVAASLCCLSTGLAVMLAQEFSFNATVSFISDCILSGAMTYFFSHSLFVLSQKKSLGGLSRRNIICVVISCCAFLMSFSSLSIMNFSPARAVAVFVILILSFALREFGGAFSGICAGATLSAACGIPSIGAVFSAAGLCSGVFHPFGPLGISATFISVCGISAVISPSPEGIALIAESAVASLVFVLIPRSKLDMLRFKLTPAMEYPSLNGREEICRKLSSASAAMQDVKRSIERTEKALEARSDSNELIKTRVKQTVCADCDKAPLCCGESAKVRESAFSDALYRLREESYISPDKFSSDFSRICTRLPRICESFNRSFTTDTANICVEEKTRQLRRTVCDSFGSIADILEEISISSAKRDTLLPAQSSAARDVFAEMGYETVETECLRRDDSRIRLTAVTKDLYENMDVRPLTLALSNTLGVNLTLPAIKDVSDGTQLIFDEKAKYLFESGVCRRCAADECGDSYSSINLEDGRCVFILSDGMGSGSRAALDSSLTAELFAELMASGLSCETALKTVNSALISKSGDESLSTVDIAVLDPYSGKISFYKAGAAPSFVKKSGRTALLEAPSLPVGILSKVSFSHAEAILGEGDIAVLVSDGVTADGCEWVQKLIRSWRGDMQSLAQELIATAASRRKGKKCDDMTAICVRLCTGD